MALPNIPGASNPSPSVTKFGVTNTSGPGSSGGGGGGGGGGSGTVTQVNTGAGLTGGPINTTGTISDANQAGVTPGTYGSSTEATVVTVNQQGRVTAVSQTPIASGSGTVTSIATSAPVTGGPITTTGTIGVSAATSSALGVVKPDGTIITVSAGAITVPTATATVFGVVKPDNSTITESSGVLTAVHTGTVTSVAVGAGLTASPSPITGSGTITANIATATTQGDVIVPTSGHLAVDGSGNISVPTATPTVFGVVKPDNVTITETGGVITSIGASPTGAAGGDLGGTYPNPTVKFIEDATAGQIQLAMGVAETVLFRNGTSQIGSVGNVATTRKYLAQTGTGSVPNAPTFVFGPEFYVADYPSLSAADTAASGAAGILVINASQTISSSTAIASPVRITTGQFTINSGQVLTFTGGIFGTPPIQIFTGSGTVVVKNTAEAYAEWWGAGTGGDDGAAFNLAITACPNTTVVALAKLYTNVNTTVSIAGTCSFRACAGCQFSGSANPLIKMGAITTGSGAGYNEWHFPSLIANSGNTALQFLGASAQTVFVTLVEGGAIGIEFKSAGGLASIDNTVHANFIASCTTAAIQVNLADTTAGNLLQGNEVRSNFVLNNKRWCYFILGSGVTNATLLNQCVFYAMAVDMNNVSSSIIIDNSTGQTLTDTKFLCGGFFGGIGVFSTGTTGVIGNGVFDSCDFDFGTPDGTAYAYSQFGITEVSSGQGNRYTADYGAMVVQNPSGQNQNLVTTAGNRSKYGNVLFAAYNVSVGATYVINTPGTTNWVAIGAANNSAGTEFTATGVGAGSGNCWFTGMLLINRQRVALVIPSGGLAVGATKDFYGYSPFVLGNARLQFTGSVMADGSGGVAVPTVVNDHSGSNANEFHIQIQNVGTATLLSAGGNLTGVIDIGGA